MKLILAHTNKITWFLVLLLAIGILSAYLNLGVVSVVASVVLPVLFILNTIVVLLALKKRNYVSLIGIVAFLFCFDFFFQFSSIDENSENSISLLSYNVRAFADEDPRVATDIIKFIDSINPDILLLQESTYKVGRNINGFEYHFLGFREGIEKSLLDI